ncbi:hypothetical protein R3W88_011751 [Solanum pinnatisectum]|uniref:Uncharacterized protein n=1 Tax=Solanum pinnatisectum TaxID=50273 RepID=A0AAV9L7J7_9SOLN|nr:hypothetical protein R3W88_011751 [Solanum pinnatisectum]
MVSFFAPFPCFSPYQQPNLYKGHQSPLTESKLKTNQGSLRAKPIGEGLKDGTCKIEKR